MDALELTSQLVAIDSVNPSLVPGGAGEAEIARFVASWARAAGLSAEVLESTPGRPSVVVRAAGSGGGRTLLLCGHLDTVGVAGMAEPFAPRVDGDRLYGRGTYDMKAGLAACLLACREAAGLGLRGDVVVAAVADEEHASLGRAGGALGASAPTRRSSPSRRSCRSSSRTRASCGRRSRSTASPRTARGRIWASTRSPPPGRS